MAENSKIEWTTHSWNPWRGCTKVSPGCKNCYAETLSGRNPGMLGVWGPQGTRVVAAESAWREPLKWDRQAKAALDQYERLIADPSYTKTEAYQNGFRWTKPDRPRVFCASLADVFEDWQGTMVNAAGMSLWKSWNADAVIASEDRPHPRTSPLTMDDVRMRLFRLIDATPHLDWLLLTKRPENITRMMPPATHVSHDVAGRKGLTLSETGPLVIRPNLWLGTSVEDQQWADERIPHLLRVPARVRFLSVEPLLGPVRLNAIKGITMDGRPGTGTFNSLFRGISWVIVGGESGGTKCSPPRPCNVEWVRSIVEQCKVAGVACFVKQLGKVPTASYYDDFRSEWEDWRGLEWPDACDWNHRDGQPPLTARVTLPLADKKGGSMEEWPEDLRVREFPTATH